MQRFVILRHTPGTAFTRTDSSVDHFDWMFEIDGTLRTWSTDPIDDLSLKEHLSAVRLPDHRMEYLDYEGEISGDRGTVLAFVRGKLTVRQIDDAKMIAELIWYDCDTVFMQHVSLQRILNPSDRPGEDRWELRLGRNETN